MLVKKLVFLENLSVNFLIWSMMKKYNYLFLLILLMTNFSPDYQVVFGENYREAVRFLQTNKQHFVKAWQPDTLRAEMAAVVFPELVRYSLVRDLLETKVLELGYVQYGADYVDFSIGRFQMKPSFVEELELQTAQYEELTSFSYKMLYRLTEAKAIRAERIRRLKDWDWQLFYVQVFYHLCLQKFDNQVIGLPSERVRLLALAYHHGLRYDVAALSKRAGWRIFPYGRNFGQNQYAYEEVASDFFEKRQELKVSF